MGSFHETGKSLKRWQSETEPAILPISECHPLVINPDKADLDKKIRLRFEQMIKMGALDEAKKIWLIGMKIRSRAKQLAPQN